MRGAVLTPLQALTNLLHQWDRWRPTLGNDKVDLIWYDEENEEENYEEDDNQLLETDAVYILGQG